MEYIHPYGGGVWTICLLIRTVQTFTQNPSLEKPITLLLLLVEWWIGRQYCIVEEERTRLSCFSVTCWNQWRIWTLNTTTDGWRKGVAASRTRVSARRSEGAIDRFAHLLSMTRPTLIINWWAPCHEVEERGRYDNDAALASSTGESGIIRGRKHRRRRDA
jgi:hypothetical protein